MLAVITSANFSCLVPVGILQLVMMHFVPNMITFACVSLLGLLYVSQPFVTLVIYYYMSSDLKTRIREIIRCHSIVHTEVEQNEMQENIQIAA